MPAIGLLYEDVADGGHGSVIVSGKLVGINTSSPGWAINDALYVSNSGTGTLTNARPGGGSEKVQKVAIVTRSDATEGSLLIMGAGRSNDVPNELTALTGVALNDTDLGTFTGATISDNTDIKTGLQELETAVELRCETSIVDEIDTNVDDLVTLSGVAENTSDLGTFTGGIITDNTTVKTALQELETEVETNITQAALHTALGISSYADDAAAQSAGLSNGDLYYNTTTSRLRVV